MNIPFNRVYLSGKEMEAISTALNSGKHCGNGQFVQKCEAFLREKYRIQKSYFTPSATAALEMATILADIQPGDEIIMPSYTFSSTANAFCLRGARPVFVDICADTLVMDHTQIEAKITSKTKALVPINYGGVSPDMDALMATAKKHNLMVIEDAAQGIGAKYKNKDVGSIAPISVFSFHETKSVSCGEGGALLLNDPSLEKLAQFAQEKGTDRSLVVAGLQNKYSWVSLGSSYLLSELLAAFLYTQLNDYDFILSLRGKVFDTYTSLFQKYVDHGSVKIQTIPADCATNYHGFYVIFPTEEKRDGFIGFMKQRGIWCYIGYLALHSSKMGREFCQSKDVLPVTEHVEKRIVRMPLHTEIKEAQLEFIAQSVKEYFHANP